MTLDDDLPTFPPDPPTAEQPVPAAVFREHVAKLEAEIEKLRNVEEKQIPESFDYDTIPSMRNEARQKLKEIRPATLGQASRISGVSPADVGLVMVWMKRGQGSAKAEDSKTRE